MIMRLFNEKYVFIVYKRRLLQYWYFLSEMCNYLLVYEYIVDVDSEGDIWGAVGGGAATRSVKNLAQNPQKNQNRNRTLLLGGRKDGYICVLNWDSGEVDFKVEAHGSKGVLSMIANSKQDQLISAGMDNVIKIWRLYPFAEEALAPLMSFYCAHTPAHMTTLRSGLCVAFEDSSTATFSTVLYNLQDKNRFDHKPDDDHVDVITGLTVCPRMKLFASASVDGTIRIWNHTNNLVRLLRLNVTPYSIGFCNSKGDLLVGLGRHLFIIPYTSYMPKAYRFKMVTMKFMKIKPEQALEYDENFLNIMNKNDVKRFKNSKSSFKFENYVDVLSPEEEKAVQKEKDVREKAFSTLLRRDDELKELKKGDIKANKISIKNKQTQDEAFTNYMKMFYDKPHITLPKEDTFPVDSANDKLNGPCKKEKDHYRPETEPTGFFPNKLSRKSILKPAKPCEMSQRILPGGFIPNSVLAKILYPAPPTPECVKSIEYRPPSLSLEQLQQIDDYGFDLFTKTSTHRRSVTFRSDDHSARVLDMGDYSEDLPSSHGSVLSKTPSPAPLSPSPAPPSPALSNKSEEDAFWGKQKTPPPAPPSNKFAGLLERTPTPKSVELAQEEELPENIVSPPVKRDRAPSKPISKLITRPVLTPTSPVSTVSAPLTPKILPTTISTPTPPPPRAVTPLPEFITQFHDVEWFEKYFPNISPSTWPKPWTADAFALSLLKVLRTTEFPNKTAVAEALILLNIQEGFTDSTCHTAARTIISVLNNQKQAPVCAVDQEKTFILTAIRALNCLSSKDKDFITELILQYLDGDRDVRVLVCDILVNCGLQDPHRHLDKELDSWDIWNLEEDDRKSDLHSMCYQWLDRWMTSYKLHIEDTLDRMKKGQNIHGRITKSQLQKHQSKAKKRGSAVSMLDDQGTVTTLPDGTEFISRPAEVDHASKTSATSSGRSITLTYNKIPDATLSESATYVDAINYFCEMMIEKELEALKSGHSAQPLTNSSDKLTNLNKNTVLVLPRLPRKQALVRLGETHTICQKRSKDTDNITEYCLPPVMNRGRHVIPGEIRGFVPAINLPLKTVYMNPFPSPLDIFDARFQEPVLITLKSEQKFFVQSNSVVPMEYSAAPSS